MRPPRSCSRLPAREDVEASSGELEREEEPEAFTTPDATGRGHTSSCRLRVRSRRARWSAATVARALIVSRSPGSENSRALLAVRRRDVEVDETDGLRRRVPPPGPATPVTAMPTSTPSRERTPFAIAAATSAETAPCSRRSARGHAELRCLDLVRVRDDAAEERRRSTPAHPSGAPRPSRPCTTRRSRAAARAPGRARGRAPRSCARPR